MFKIIIYKSYKFLKIKHSLVRGFLLTKHSHIRNISYLFIGHISLGLFGVISQNNNFNILTSLLISSR